MYRLGLEGILGLRRRGNSLHIRPRVPKSWPGYRLHYRWKSSTLDIKVRREAQTDSNHVQEVLFDGEVLEGTAIPLIDDGQRHEVVVMLGDRS
jgi:cyclic beta-1,2-glucan synthetase